MISYYNPFEYERANKLSPEKIIDFYIEDYSYSRFIQSRRNVFLVGERGTGKTMTLLYNSFPVQSLKAEQKKQQISNELICIYIPCNTPITHRREYELLEDYQASIISEHFLTISIMYSIIDSLANLSSIIEAEDKSIRKEIEFIFDFEIPESGTLFDGLKLCFQKEIKKAQMTINSKEREAFYENAISFSSGVIPLITLLTKTKCLQNTHFSLMLDDSHDLNKYQIQALNSWIAYRDNSIVSFKVATTKIGTPSFITASGGTILEGHDYSLVDIEQPYQNRFSEFGKLAREIIKKRLEKLNIEVAPDNFFPPNPSFLKDIEECKKISAKDAKQKFPEATQKQIIDHVYKYARAEYFRRRSRKANRPPYSGFDILVHLSTGVIRNLLEPCYWMYDKVVSELHSPEGAQTISEIPPEIQNDVIMSLSKRKWTLIKNGLDKSIEGCSKEQGDQLFKLFDNLAILFNERLLHHKSEPRAVSFSISDTNYFNIHKLEQLLEIAQKAQLLYTRLSSAKDSGRREPYYIPNRILWPERGLDPHGQHARVSIRARDLWAAAAENKKIPFNTELSENKQRGLFHA